MYNQSAIPLEAYLLRLKKAEKSHKIQCAANILCTSADSQTSITITPSSPADNALFWCLQELLISLFFDNIHAFLSYGAFV